MSGTPPAAGRHEHPHDEGRTPDDGRMHDDAHGEHRFRAARAWLERLPGPVRVPLVVTIGSLLIAAGAAMLVLPGPGLLVMFAGVAVLSAEFPWAGRLVVRIRALATRVWVPLRRWLRRER